MTPRVGLFVCHLPTGIVGVVEKVYAAGEHPKATCEVVRLSTGDELVLTSGDDFDPLSDHEARTFKVLAASFRGLVASTQAMAAQTGIPSARVAHLFRAALAEVLRHVPEVN